MIYTVTLNPSIDYVAEIDELEIGSVNRVKREQVYPGGKGINVSLMLNELQQSNIAFGFVGGFTGEYIEQVLQTEGVRCDFIKVQEGFSRINLKLKSNKETEINGNGPKISAQYLQDFYEKLDHIEKDDLLVLCGSIPNSMSEKLYEQIVEKVGNKNIKVVVDATNQLLRNTLKYHPFLIKPNKHELEELFHVKIENMESTIHYAKKLQELGAKNVLVSLGKDGAILVDEFQNIYSAKAIKGKVKNTVGSGDSMVAGFISGYLTNNNYREAILQGIACGSATAFSDGIGKRELIDELKKQVYVEVQA